MAFLGRRFRFSVADSRPSSARFPPETKARQAGWRLFALGNVGGAFRKEKNVPSDPRGFPGLVGAHQLTRTIRALAYEVGAPFINRPV
jgi:hypothetical protein